MLTDDRKQIYHLNPVKINYDLYKWQEGNPTPMNMDDMRTGIGNSVPFESNIDVWDGVSFAVKRRFNSEFLQGVAELYIRFRLFFGKPKKKPVDVFMGIKKNFGTLRSEELKSDKEIKSMLEALEKSKQHAAKHSIVRAQSIKSQEDKLIAAGITQYQTEESLIKFIKQCKKGLCLTEIETFERVIPGKVMVKFDAAEITGVFDNYLILYYDPKKIDNKYYTAEKDPILFGVIKGSDKLYFIADWIDEHCNLTYKDILQTKNAVDFKLDS